MKRFIFCLLILVPEISFEQNLKDIFLSLPDHYVRLDKFQREHLINKFLEGKNNYENGVGKDRHYLTAYDPENGYLLFTGAYEGSTSVASWNISTGEKLIGIVYESCGGACDYDVNFLLLLDNNYLKLGLNEVLPRLLFSDFMDIDKMKADKIDVDNEISIFNDLDLHYILPSKGKNIMVESQYQDWGMSEKLNPYNLGRKIELLWDNGKFLKGSLIK